MQHRAAARIMRNFDRRGFALVAVIWSLGLIVLLGTAVIVGARYRGGVASVDTSAARAAAAAETSVNIAIAAILTQEPNLKFPLRCNLPGGELAIIAVEEEIGKVDLNAASRGVVERLFVGLTRDKVLGAQIAASLIAVREEKRAPTGSTSAPATSEGGNPGAPAVRFTSITELDRIRGVSPDLFRVALPLVTVRSGRTEPDGRAAPPALAQLLGLDSSAIAQERQVSVGDLTVRADVRTPDGSRYVREVLISIGGEQGRPYVIREWRRGYARSDGSRSDEIPLNDGSARRCLLNGQMPS